MGEIGTPKLVQSDIRDGVMVVTLNSPQKRNALSEAMLDELHNLLDMAGSDDTVRVLVLRAAGTVFSAGHDLSEMVAARENSDHGLRYYQKIMNHCSGMMQKIVNLPKPVIADVRGVATAAGCQLVASCDLAYATPDAKFATPGVHIGLFCSTPMVALSRNITSKNAMEMLLTGDSIDAATAQDLGLINSVWPHEEIEEQVNMIAKKICSKSLRTIRFGKEAFYKQKQMPLDEAYSFCSEVMTENMMTADAKEGINAFLEKRSPNWTDA